MVRASRAHRALLIALALSCTTRARAYTTICKVDSDFNADLQTDWGTCEEFLGGVLKDYFRDKASWANVTDEEIRAKMVTPDFAPDDCSGSSGAVSGCQIPLLGELLLMDGWPSRCCGGTLAGGIANLRGVDGTLAKNFCQKAADMDGPRVHPLAALGSDGGSGSCSEWPCPGTTCAAMNEYMLYLGLAATSWDDVACEKIDKLKVAMDSDWTFGDSSSGTSIRGYMASACCGGQDAVVTAATGGGKAIALSPSASRKIVESACPNAGSEAAVVTLAPNITECPSGDPDYGCGCEYDDTLGSEAYLPSLGEYRCIMCSSGHFDQDDEKCVSCDEDACGCPDGQECFVDRDWSSYPYPYVAACRVRCYNDVEDLVEYPVYDDTEEKCVTRCADGGTMKLISADPSAPTGRSEPIVTAASWSSASQSAPDVIDCPDTPGEWRDACGCDYDEGWYPLWADCDDEVTVGCDNEISGGRRDRHFQCAKCPAGAYFLEEGVLEGAKCLSCPPDQPRFSYDSAQRCYEPGGVPWQVAKCNVGGNLTDPAGAGNPATTVDLGVSECPNWRNGSFSICGMSDEQRKDACGCPEGSTMALMDANGRIAQWGEYMVYDDVSSQWRCGYLVDEPVYQTTQNVPDGYAWQCFTCPGSSTPMTDIGKDPVYRNEFLPNLPGCSACPDGMQLSTVYSCTHGCVCVPVCAWRENVYVCLDERAARKKS